MTQVNPQPPTLYNVDTDTVISHWVTVVAPTTYGLEVLDLSIGEFVAHFYADNGLVASTQPERLQRKFNLLTGLFNRVVLRMNMMKTFSMACHTCHPPDRMS